MYTFTILCLLTLLLCLILMLCRQKSKLQQLQKQLALDPLTGTQNRYGYEKDIATYEKQPPSSLGCLYIDVDNLHKINNCYGHRKGDQILSCIGTILIKFFGQEQVYRIGGDEFIVLSPYIPQKQFIAKQKQLQRLFYQQQLTASIGGIWNISPLSVNHCLETAEREMYRKKINPPSRKKKEK